MDLGIANVAAIVVISYFVGQGVKASKLDNKWIPIFCGASGAVLGLIAYFIGMPDLPAADPITALAIGVASGLAATGVNQVYKQLSSPSNDEVAGAELDESACCEFTDEFTEDDFGVEDVFDDCEDEDD